MVRISKIGRVEYEDWGGLWLRRLNPDLENLDLEAIDEYEADRPREATMVIYSTETPATITPDFVVGLMFDLEGPKDKSPPAHVANEAGSADLLASVSYESLSRQQTETLLRELWDELGNTESSTWQRRNLIGGEWIVVISSATSAAAALVPAVFKLRDRLQARLAAAKAKLALENRSESIESARSTLASLYYARIKDGPDTYKKDSAAATKLAGAFDVGLVEADTSRGGVVVQFVHHEDQSLPRDNARWVEILVDPSDSGGELLRSNRVDV